MQEQGSQEFCVCMYVLWMNAHTFLITTRALAVAVMMEVQEGKMQGGISGGKQGSRLTASPDEEMIQEVFRHRYLCSSQKTL